MRESGVANSSSRKNRYNSSIAISLVFTVTIWISLGKLYPAESMTGLSGAWQTASMRWPSGSSTKAQ